MLSHSGHDVASSRLVVCHGPPCARLSYFVERAPRPNRRQVVKIWSAESRRDANRAASFGHRIPDTAAMARIPDARPSP